MSSLSKGLIISRVNTKICEQFSEKVVYKTPDKAYKCFTIKDLMKTFKIKAFLRLFFDFFIEIGRDIL